MVQHMRKHSANTRTNARSDAHTTPQIALPPPQVVFGRWLEADGPYDHEPTFVDLNGDGTPEFPRWHHRTFS